MASNGVSKTVRLSRDMDARVGHACIDRDISFQDAAVEALTMWVAGVRVPKFDLLEGVQEEDKALLLALPEFLRHSPSASAVRAIVQQWIDGAAKRKR